ncbi:MAG: glycerophosphodiester phosphodiesterase family protein [Rhizomicrobium sp.]|jgi:glycerophosphoryl diester phosphodiesterase
MSIIRIAHRGGAALKPENTLTAFADAIARGADGAELDVQLTRDGHVVVFHDFRFNPDICRNENGSWVSAPAAKIVDLALNEIKSVDVGRARPGSNYDRSHTMLEGHDGESIPLLAEVIELARNALQPFRLFVELKSSFTDPSLSAPPELLAEKTLSVVTDLDFLDRVVFVGFDWRGLRRVKSLSSSAECWFTTLAQSWFGNGVPPAEDEPPAGPALQILRHWASTGTSPWAAGFDAVAHGGSILEAIKAAGGGGWFPFHRDANRASIREAHRLGLKVGAWTVDDAEDMRSLATNGIDAICTDRTDLIMGL